MSKRLVDRPVLAIGVLMLLFVATTAVSDGIALAAGLRGEAAKLAVKLVVFGLSLFVVAPALLRLPTGSSTIRSFPADVGLTRIRPLTRNLFLLLIIYATFAASQTAGQWVHHLTSGSPFLVDFGRHDLLGTTSVTSGIFEEIVMRGVMLTYLLTRLSKRRAVLVSSAVFAGIHLLNLLNPASDPTWVLAQVVWAFFMGILYAELLIGTRSLYLPILIHYLINGTVGVWFHGLDTQSPASALLGIPFFGVLPALLGLLWLRLLTRRA